MTTSHDKELLPEALWFAGKLCGTPNVDFSDTVILHIAREGQRAAILELYRESQVMADEA